ncbi:MAG: hypothetical protein V8T86_11515 [Victivallis sp.]
MRSSPKSSAAPGRCWLPHSAEYGAALLEAFPAGEHARPLARTFRVRGPHKTAGRAPIVTAGSSDAGVAREALHALKRAASAASS